MDANRLYLLELCFIANKRNLINNKRHRFLGRKNYWVNAARAVRWFQSPHGSTKHPYHGDCRDSWLKIGLHKIRLYTLENHYKYTMAKCETMRLTIKTRNKVKLLSDKLKAHIRYKNGYIDHIRIPNGPGGGFDINYDQMLSRNEIAAMSRRYEEHMAVQNMLKD